MSRETEWRDQSEGRWEGIIGFLVVQFVCVVLLVLLVKTWDRECEQDERDMKMWETSKGVSRSEVADRSVPRAKSTEPVRERLWVPEPEPRVIRCVAYGSVAPEDYVSVRGWHDVWATREGLVGKKTATGRRIKSHDVFVALPCRSALGKTVLVRAGDKTIRCKVEDVGPWSIADSYWKTGRRPLAESGKRIPRRWGRARNRAGIDLSDGLWRKLGLSWRKGIVKVSWRFARDQSV